MMEFLVGGMIKYDLGLKSIYTNTNKPSYVSMGLLYRVKDAAIVLLNIDYRQVYKIGFSYDINISQLTAASQTRGGIELHIGYTGFFDKK